MKKVIALALVVVAILSLAACTPGAPPASSQPAASSAAAASPAAPAASASVAEASASGSVPAKKYVVGFANIAESNQTCVQIGDTIVAEGKKLNLDVIRVNNNFDGATAVKNVDDLLTKGIDALIEFNVDASVAPVIMEKANTAKIPVFAIDIPHPGATFFGANNKLAGEIAGEYLGNLAKTEWNGQIDCLMLVDQMASGDLPRQRVLNYEPGIQKYVPDFNKNKDQIFFVEGKQDAGTAQQVVSDFLSAHPDWHHILMGSLQDDGYRGLVAAVEVAGRQKDVLAVGQNENFWLEYVKTHKEENFARGAVAFFLTDYGKWLMPAVRDKLDGKTIPDSVYVDHVVVDRSNVAKYFPNN